MAINPRQLRPTELVRLLNSTPLGEVISERQLLRHRSRAGFRIGDDRHLDLFRYVAWLVAVRHAPKPEPDVDPYESLKERARARNAALSLAGRDIGEIPAVINPKRKARAEKDFRYFCEAYFSAAFSLPWSPDHLKVIAKIERAVLTGGLFAQAMPRGSGKTTLTTVACVWAILFGACPFVCLIAASAERARSLLANIKTWFETNELLLEDFPEVVYPVRKLGRITNRQMGQIYNEEPTRIEWNADKIVLPTIPGSKASGAVMTTSGMKGSEIRGQNHPLVDGTIIRPSLVVIDDPQTTESAWSLSQCKQRENILASDILGMAGPGQKIAAILCCTVIRSGDMADNILDRTKHPQWQGERTKMVYSFHTDEKLWARYAEMRAESFRNDGDGREATEFYRQNRNEMDAGSAVAWPERYNNDEVSAIQHAMNLKLRNKAAFFAEYQNEPLPDEDAALLLTADKIASKINYLPRGVVPKTCSIVTAFIDVQDAILYYAVCAWEQNFTGYCIDYGTMPRQPASYFSAASPPITLAMQFPGTGVEGGILAGLESLSQQLLGKQWLREDQAVLHIGKCFVDAHYKTEIVKSFCRRSPHAAVLMPSHGWYVGAKQTPFSQYRHEPGARNGYYWRIPAPKGSDIHILMDVNHWKSHIHSSFSIALGDTGSLSFWGDDPLEHRLIADHLTAEIPKRVTCGKVEKDEWQARAGRPDNHWLDCLVGCAAAASLLGVAVPGIEPPKRRKNPFDRPSLAAMIRER